jgi:hypothetical protein
VLDDLAVLHDRDEVADLRRDPQIMGDEDDGKAKPPAQLAQQPVPTGARLVGFCLMSPLS